ncbi:MAG: amidohydrolase family protein, partial [Prevotellaceae bacterium]|nr:amidohydrolase family protein [Prevotellaceae bacterium]
MRTVITNGTIVDGRKSFIGTIIIEENYISKVVEGNLSPELLENVKVINAKGCYVIPGAIDTHVHFREPGLTQKGDWRSESRAAVAGGVTSVMDMPNTIPQTTSEELMWEKKNLAAEHSLVNYAAFIGATSDNISQLKKL